DALHGKLYVILDLFGDPIMPIFRGQDLDRNQLRPREDLLDRKLARENAHVRKTNFGDIYAGPPLSCMARYSTLFRVNRTRTKWHAGSCCGRIHPRYAPL